MSKDDEASKIADLLGIKYAHAVRLIREVNDNGNAKFVFSDLAHACREIKEREERTPKPKRKRGVLPKGAGRVYCTASDKCDATAAADGQGSPIVLKHDDGCPDKYPIKDHLYDAGFPRDDSKGCIVNYARYTQDEPDICGRPLSEHAHSEYQEDGR